MIHRIAQSLLGIELDDLAAEELEDLDRALRSSQRSLHQWRLVLFNAFAIGVIVAIAAFLYALGFSALFMVPRLLAGIVVGWLVHDVLQHRFDIEEGLGHFVFDVAEEIEHPNDGS